MEFFTDGGITNELFGKFKQIVASVPEPKHFRIMEDSFRLTGYSKIREQLQNIDKIQIIIGIDTSDIFRKHNTTLFFVGGKTTEAHAKTVYASDFIEDIGDVVYNKEIEDGLKMLSADLASGKVELKIHTTNKLRTNIYLLTYQGKGQYKELHCGIMGQGNLSRLTLAVPFHSINQVLTDDCLTKFVKDEFDKMWTQAIPVTLGDIEGFRNKTHLGQSPSAYELYLKVLIDYFGSQIEDSMSFQMPQDFMKLKYQIDAVIQGYDMLLRHNGFFLADVVGLGKTVVAGLVAKRFVESNGIYKTKILVIYPPAVESNWKNTFEKFGLMRYTQFASIGVLDKVLDPLSDYWAKEEYDLIFVDEAHRFRNDTSAMFDDLQRICKADRNSIGDVKGGRKKVVLVTATPLNNRPDDLYNLLRLFQDVRNSTISGVANLQKYFAPKIAEYKQIMRDRDTITAEEHRSIVDRINALYDPIRREVIDQVTIRRTRDNIKNNPVYNKDIEFHGIKFPVIERPREVEYLLDSEMKDLFGETMDILTSRLKYARYKAIERITGVYKHRYPKAGLISWSLGVIYRTHMVKRLESSFEAFRLSLGRLLHATEVMIRMFENDRVIIAPDLKINKLIEEGWSFEEIIEEGTARFGIKADEFVYHASDFDADFIKELNFDAELLRRLIKEWQDVDQDPKLDKLVSLMRSQLFNLAENPTGKLVIFSESRDTIMYLAKELRQMLQREDILAVSASERAKLQIKIQENFDANYGKIHKNDYNIVITTDTLAEGVNLHRANVIVNYDTPWNATRLMQRIGRVNRIGSVSGAILNYLFYPTAQGDEQISLYQNALAKLQGFHSAYGEDAQIYSREEIVQQFELFNPRIGDDEDKRGVFLNELREFFNDHPEEYGQIKKLPFKSRATRRAALSIHNGIPANTSLVYISSSYKSAYYMADTTKITELTFLEAAQLFRATRDEEPETPRFSQEHYSHVYGAFNEYDVAVRQFINSSTIGVKDKDPQTNAAIRFVRSIWRLNQEQKIIDAGDKFETLIEYLNQGVYAHLAREVVRIEKKYAPKETYAEKIVELLLDQYEKYYAEKEVTEFVEQNFDVPHIVLSETFM